jgi:hypothetical protein
MSILDMLEGCSIGKARGMTLRHLREKAGRRAYKREGERGVKGGDV